MTAEDFNMIEALVLHMGQKIDQIAGSALSPIGQILIDELRSSSLKLQAIVLRDRALQSQYQGHFQGQINPQSQPSEQSLTEPHASAAPAPLAGPAQVQIQDMFNAPPYPPAEVAETRQRALHPASVPAPGSTFNPPNATQQTKRKVLFLIDDDKDAQKVLSYMFERKSSFQVISHTDPLKAWEDIKTHPPDLILMDLMMPGINGLDLLKNIRQIPDLQNVKILIGSSKSFDKDRIEVLKAGANDFIAKPYNFTELLLRLNKLVG